MTLTLFARILGDSTKRVGVIKDKMCISTKQETFVLSSILGDSTKRVGVIKDKMCILTKQETFVLSSICLKCQHTQIKAFLCFELKGDGKGRGTAITKQLLFGYPDIFGICLIKQKFLVWSKYTFYLL